MGVRIVARAARSEGQSVEAVYEFNQDRIVIGRGRGADVRIPDTRVSDTHATVRVSGTSYVLVDENSTNGTRLNGVRIVPARPKPLRSGDAIELANYTLQFQSGVPVSELTSADRTAALAKQWVREALGEAGQSVGTMRLTALSGVDAEKSFELPAPPARLVVGRGLECNFVLADADASREHFELVCDADGVVLRDLESKNGILVNNREVKERRLRDRDEITVGSTVIVFEDPAEVALGAFDVAADEPEVTPESRPPLPSQSVIEPPSMSTVEEPATHASEEEPKPKSHSKLRSRFGVESVILLIAAAVLALSVAGFLLLLRGV